MPATRKKVDKEYKIAHSNVYALRGRASDHPCADCSEPARQWAYDHADYFEETTASGLLFSNDPAHYQPRCTRCHRLFDIRMRKIPRATATPEEREQHRQQQEEDMNRELDAVFERMGKMLWPNGLPTKTATGPVTSDG